MSAFLLRLHRIVASRVLLFAALLCGVLAWLLLPGPITGYARVIGAWDIGVTVFLVLSAFLFFSQHVERMPAHAEAQEEGEWTIFAVTVAVTTISFVVVIKEFAAIKSLPAGSRSPHVLLVAYTLLVSWLMTQVTFGFRYAHEYYSRLAGAPDFDRGLDFPKENQPDYLDFFYFALVLGMTFQVSDVQITARKLRRLAALQGLLSFLFNAVIIALTVNLAASLLG